MTDNLGFLERSAYFLGTNPPAFRLLLSVLVAYPLSIYYRKFMFQNVTKTQSNLFFTFCGILICIFNYGYEVYHSLLAVVTTYLFIHLLYKNKLMVPISFTFNMGYLLIGYYYTTTENYDIKWTMCHCVQVLHLIGLTFDVSDSIKNPDVIGITDDRPLKIPSLLEICAFTYFPATVLIGPQFSFKRFYQFIDYKYSEGKQNMTHGFTRGFAGLIYLAIYQLGLYIVPDSYLLSPAFNDKNLFSKLLLLGVWGRCTLYKYISCWILSEGAATCFGLTWVGKDPKTEKEDWTACANINISIFENTRKFGDYVDSFNVQTNQWVLKYVYKRLRFLGNKSVSHISALMFLAVWHGFHCGYYMTFFMEFVIIHFEKEMEPVFSKNEKFQQFINLPTMRPIIYILLRFYTITFSGYCLVPFSFLSFSRWWAIYKSCYFIGFIVFFPALHVYRPLIKKLVNHLFPKEDTNRVKENSSEEDAAKHVKSN